ncbi:MAG: patatin-like phospholipase family protein [Bacteroidales bacterium]|nr:patatin-like phospholipase family protein [Bacteroidales bacterium]MBR4147544.1 patatin-like phospholipase family protein [Bacteroidales bacterium]
MKRLSLTLAVILVLTAFAPLSAQNEANSSRLKVGVVLGGGGAKGASHIGVLKYIEEMGIPVDFVAGTSMGSIIGGFYAMGYSPEELTQLIAGMDWSQYIGNKIERPLTSKEVRERNSTMQLQVPFSSDNFFDNDPSSSFISQLPSSYVNNSALINLFNDLCVGYQEEMDFNDMPIPFACVATDMITGKEVVLRSGSVPTAMRASMAIPGLFSPVVIGDKVLVDGGLVNNFPADVLREMGADIIIGVEVTSTKDVTIHDLKSLPQVFARLVITSTSAKRVDNRSMCDVHIIPDISGFGMLSFTPEAIDTLVGRGYKRASEFHDQLLAIKEAVDASAGQPVMKMLHAPHAKNLSVDSVTIRSINFNDVSEKESRWLLRKSGLREENRYLENDIDKAMKIYRGTGCFDEITYLVKESDSIHKNDRLSNAYDLSINVKHAKPHLFGLGVRYDTEEGSALLLKVGLNEKRFNGSKLSLSAKLSYNPKVNLTYTYSRAGLANFNLAYDYRNEHFRTSALDVTDNNLVNLHYRQNKLSAYISQFHLLNLSTVVGVSYTSTTFDNASLEGSFLDSIWFIPNRFLTPFVDIEYDCLDDDYFAKRGLYADLNSHYYWDPMDGGNNNFDIGFALQYYMTPKNGRLTIIPQVYGRYFLNETSFYNLRNRCGGEIQGRHFENQLPFIGIPYLETFGTVPSLLTIARCDLRYNLFGNHYLTAMYNGLLRIDYAHGAGLKYAYNSPLGPISLTAQWSNIYQNRFSLYFSFGYTF